MRTQKPDKLISLDNKPIITETSYPYYSMDHRSFELLLYALYEQEIRHGELAGMYNDIWLMEGVREKGKDCALYKQGELAAVIQCKHRSKLTSIGKVDVAKEIIKFVLHIINNRQEVVQPFNYYFVVSSDFDSKSRELLEDFNNRIILEKDIEKWTASVINETKTLSQLELADIRQPLHHFLTSMVVHHKASTDITLLLNKPYNTHIIEMFFSIKKVIDVSTVLSETEKIQTKLANIQNSLKTPPSEEEVMEQFSRSSALLSTYNNYFFNLPQSHITRKETTELFNWIKTPLPSAKDEDKILLLTGNAGYGKSVILRDLFEALRGENIPVLGIKADRYPVSSVKELEEKLYLKNNIYGQLQSLSSQFEKVVVLIDQIDALSQTLSSQREALSAYRLFINAIKEIDNVRIIISVRTFDLNYDPDLQFYKSQKIVPVALLNEEEVNGVLSNLNLDPSTVSSSLKVLLKTPNHLNVFCKIFKPGYAIESIKTVQDLYQQLWKQTVVEIPTGSALNSLSVKQCLQTLARYINEKQQISLNPRMYIDEMGRELYYLKSQGILVTSDTTLEFFHQTFYDFVFAKAFIESGQSVIGYILRNRNSLYIRSSLKMIIGFLREYDHFKYISVLSDIIASRKILFHIRLLAINLLGFVENPSVQELQFISKQILPNKNRRVLFLESVFSEELLKFLIEQKVIDELLLTKVTRKKTSIVQKFIGKVGLDKKQSESAPNSRNLCYSLLARHLPQSRRLIVHYLSNAVAFEEKPQFIFQLLYYIKHWDFEDAFRLFERYQEVGYSDTFQFFHILHDAIDTDPDWVISIYEPLLNQEISEGKSIKKEGQDTYQEEQIIDKLFKNFPDKAFRFGWRVLCRLTDNDTPYRYNPLLLSDQHFSLYDYDRRESERGTFNEIYTQMIETLSLFQHTERSLFQEFSHQIIQSNKMAFLRMMVYSFNNQSEPLENFKDDAFYFVKNVNAKNALITEEKFEFHLRRCLQRFFPYFSREQKDAIFEIILNLKDPFELHKHNFRGGPDFFKNYGLTKYQYLSSLPREEVLAEPKARRVFQELERRYKNIKDTEPNKVRMYGVGAPLNRDAYKNMDFDNWIKSFRKYDSDNRHIPEHPEKGGLTEHYRAFKAEIEKRPDYFFPFIERLLEEQVHPQYIVAGLDGLKSGKVNPTEFAKLFKRIMRLPLDQFGTLQMIWMADYLIQNEVIDEEILDFIIDKALNHPDPSEDKGQPKHEAINTVRGGAVEKLTKIDFNRAWADRIFDALEKVVDDPQVSVRVSLVTWLAYLMNLDERRTISIFIKATRAFQKDIYQASIWSVQYLAHNNFNELQFYFRNFLDNPRDIEDIATIIAVGYLNDRPGSKQLIRQCLKKGDIIVAKVVHVGWFNVLNKEKKVKERAARLFFCAKHTTSEKILHEYSVAFLKWQPEEFPILFPIIYRFSRSKAGRIEMRYYYEYLLKCMKVDPEKCLRLVANFKSHQKSNLRRQVDEQPVKLSMGLFNALDKIPGKKKKAQKALIMFDSLLRDSHYRRNASKATEQVDL